MARRGMGKGKGKGYKNIIGKDPSVHAQSAKGIKQPQRINNRVSNPNQALVEKNGIVTFQDKQPGITQPEVKMVKKNGFFKKVGRGIKEFAEFGKEELRQMQIEKRAATLKEIKHPLVKKLETQKMRVDTIKAQRDAEESPGRKDRLDAELEREENQLRTIQEKITNVRMEDLTDRELKTLAIRIEPGIFGGNPYEEELVKRKRKEAEIQRRIKEVQTEQNIKMVKLNRRLKEEKKAALSEDRGFF